MTRIHGLDLARALAIIGMMAAHLGPEAFLTDGYPSVLFAVLAGVSMGVISRGVTDGAGDLLRTRFRLILRGVILAGLGAFLALAQAGIYEVLSAIGLSYLLLTPVVRWPVRRLAVLLGGLVLLGPVLAALDQLLSVSWGDEGVADVLFGVYPLLAWLAYVLVGLLIHRLVVRAEEPGLQVRLLVAGLAVFAAAQLTVELTGFRAGPDDVLTGSGAYLQAEPHSGGLLDVLSSAGAAMAVIAACLLACRVAAVVWASYPLRAMGAMSLTVYVVHVIVTTIANGTFVTVRSVYDGGPQPYLPKGDFGWGMYTPLTDASEGASASFEPGFPGYLDEPVYGDPGVGDPNWLGMFAAQLIVFLIFASLWRRRLRRGPLEWGVHRVIEGTVGPVPERR